MCRCLLRFTFTARYSCRPDNISILNNAGDLIGPLEIHDLKKGYIYTRFYHTTMYTDYDNHFKIVLKSVIMILSNDYYLSPNESLITAKRHWAAKLKLVTVPLTIYWDSWVMTFILTKCYREKITREKLKLGLRHIRLNYCIKQRQINLKRKEQRRNLKKRESWQIATTLWLSGSKYVCIFIHLSSFYQFFQFILIPKNWFCQRKKMKPLLYHCQWMWHLHWYGNMGMELSLCGLNLVMLSLYYPHSRD